MKAKVILIGAGNVGLHLGMALYNAGYQIIQVYSKQLENAEILAEKINSEAINSFQKIKENADFYIFCLKDDVLANISTEIKLHGKLVIHTSGSLNMKVLESISERCGVLYPLQTFSKNIPINFGQIPICVEAWNKADEIRITNLAENLSSEVFYLNSSERKNAHLAAVFTNNFTNHLLYNAIQILKNQNIPENILQPLAQETVRKAFEAFPENPQTGPAIRGDENTLNIHRKMLEVYPEIKDLYDFLTENIQQQNNKNKIEKNKFN